MFEEWRSALKSLRQYLHICKLDIDEKGIREKLFLD